MFVTVHLTAHCCATTTSTMLHLCMSCQQILPLKSSCWRTSQKLSPWGSYSCLRKGGLSITTTISKNIHCPIKKTYIHQNLTISILHHPRWSIKGGRLSKNPSIIGGGGVCQKITSIIGGLSKSNIHKAVVKKYLCYETGQGINSF